MDSLHWDTFGQEGNENGAESSDGSDTDSSRSEYDDPEPQPQDEHSKQQEPQQNNWRDVLRNILTAPGPSYPEERANRRLYLEERARQREKAERERAEREKAERERAERERAERERAERERAERERAEREKAEREKAERERTRTAKARVEVECTCWKCGSVPKRSAERTETRGRHHRDISEGCCCCCSARESPRRSVVYETRYVTKYIDKEEKVTAGYKNSPERGRTTEQPMTVAPTSRPQSAPPATRKAPTVVKPLGAERKDAAVEEVPAAQDTTKVEQKEKPRNESTSPSPNTDKAPATAKPLSTGEKEGKVQGSPCIIIPSHTLGLMSPVRLVSVFWIFTGTGIFLTMIPSPWSSSRNPWIGGSVALFLATGFAYHDCFFRKEGYTACGLNSILDWI
ncbi:hypothetical protein PG990_010790 [Apiospora arundinis]